MSKLYNDLSCPSKSSTSNPLRISDILLQYHDDSSTDFDLSMMADFRDGCGSLQCSSPWRIVTKWCSKERKRKSMAVYNEKRRDDIDRIVEAARCSISGLNGGDLSASTASVLGLQGSGGICRDSESSNMEVGRYLLHLAATTKEELEKMIELRGQMEMLVGSAKEKMEERKEACVYSTTDAQEGSAYEESQISSQVCGTLYDLPQSSTSTVCDRPVKRDLRPQYEMDQLEAQLEAELKLLHNHSSQEKRWKHTQQDKQYIVKDAAASSRSDSFGSGEIIDNETEPLHETNTGDDNGICPYELEKRLHELLETRQEEQISELQAALECANNKLEEKEIEVSWWKETARLMSLHIPDTSRSTLRLEPEFKQSTYIVGRNCSRFDVGDQQKRYTVIREP